MVRIPSSTALFAGVGVNLSRRSCVTNEAADGSTVTNCGRTAPIPGTFPSHARSRSDRAPRRPPRHDLRPPPPDPRNVPEPRPQPLRVLLVGELAPLVPAVVPPLRRHIQAPVLPQTEQRRMERVLRPVVHPEGEPPVHLRQRVDDVPGLVPHVEDRARSKHPPALGGG